MSRPSFYLRALAKAYLLAEDGSADERHLEAMLDARRDKEKVGLDLFENSDVKLGEAEQAERDGLKRRSSGLWQETSAPPHAERCWSRIIARVPFEIRKFKGGNYQVARFKPPHERGVDVRLYNFITSFASAKQLADRLATDPDARSHVYGARPRKKRR